MPSSANDLAIRERNNTIVTNSFFIQENLGNKPTQKGQLKY
jgi:hypothetical protein